MIIYSVTVSIESSLANEWLNWMLVRHIPDVMDTGYFARYDVRKLLEPPPEPGHETYNIQYQCRSRDQLEEYQQKEAPRLQQEHKQRYRNRFVAFRSILEDL
jgi:hypothetical protein